MPNWKKVIVSGSDAVLNNITATGDVTVQGDIIAENYIVSSSVTYMTQSFSSGSTIFGDDYDLDTHQFTGSLFITGITYDDTPVTDGLLAIDNATGKLYYTGSYGDAGGGLTITNDGPDRVLTSNNDGTINAEANVTITSTAFNIGKNLVQSTSTGRAITSEDSSGLNRILIGDIQGAGNRTLLDVNDNTTERKISLTTYLGNTSTTWTSYFHTGSIFLSGSLTVSADNGTRHYFTGSVTSTNGFIADGGNVVSKQGNIQTSNYLYHYGDLNTFIGFPSNDTIQLTAGGTNVYSMESDRTTISVPITASSDISASGYLYAGLDEDNNTDYKTVVYNTTTGQLFYTGSYGGGEDTDWYIDGTNITSSRNVKVDGYISASNYLMASDIRLGNQKFAIPSTLTPDNFIIGNSGEGSLILTNITASGDISASNFLYAKAPEDVSGNYNNVVVYNTSNGQFYYTGSYGGASLNLQDVTDNGETTTNGGWWLYDQTYKWGGWSTGAPADAGFQDNGTEAYTYVTPQREVNKFYLTGHRATPQDPSSGKLDYGRNYIVYNPAVYFNGETIVGNGGTPTDGEVGGLVVEGGSLQLKANAITGSVSESAAISFVPGDEGPTMYFFERASEIPNQSGSINHNSASAKFVFNTSSKSLNIFAGSTDEDLVEVMHISKSGNSPRIGIGTNNPLTNFDFKDVSDSRTGTKMILRSSRPNKGGNDGDEAGKINFVIDSSSYGDIETSGSVAKILGSATSIGTDGAAGKLSFEVSDVYTPNIKNDTTEVFRLQKNPLGSLDLTYTVGVFEGSVNLNGSNSSLYAGKDVEAVGNFFTTNGYVKANNLRIGTNSNPGTNSAIIAGDLILNNDFTSSGDISSSGDVIGATGSFDVIFGGTF